MLLISILKLYKLKVIIVGILEADAMIASYEF